MDFKTKLMLLVAIFGIISFLLVSSTFPFKDKLFNTLFPKPTSYAAYENAFDLLNFQNQPLQNTGPDTYAVDELEVIIHLKDANALVTP